jgi:hypothetical protein
MTFVAAIEAAGSATPARTAQAVLLACKPLSPAQRKAAAAPRAQPRWQVQRRMPNLARHGRCGEQCVGGVARAWLDTCKKLEQGGRACAVWHTVIGVAVHETPLESDRIYGFTVRRTRYTVPAQGQ